MSADDSWLLALWRRVLHLYPEPFRRAFEQEILEVLLRQNHAAREQLSRPARALWRLRMTADLLAGAFAERLRGRSVHRSEGRLGLVALVEDFAFDVRLATRRFAKSPGFTAVAVLLLALGLGANSTIFALMQAVVLRPLPFAEPHQLVSIWESNPSQGWDQFTFSHPNYLDHRARQRTFLDLAAFTDRQVNLVGPERPQQIAAGSVTPSLFPVLGVEAMRGRLFAEEEGMHGQSEPLVLLTRSFWQEQMGGADVVGQTLVLDGSAHSVIGVVPDLPRWMGHWDLLLPLRPNPDRHRDDRRLTVFGRLRPEFDRSAAESDLDAIAATLAERFPASNTGFDTRVISLHETVVGEELQTSMTLLTGAVTLVLFMAVANLANLLLARSCARRSELAVAVALGSTRSRILSQLITESLLLAVLGGLVGLGISAALVRLFLVLDPGTVPRLGELRLDATTASFTLLMAALTGLTSGLLPAWQATRGSVQQGLQGLRGAARGGMNGAWRSTLVGVEVAVSAVLLLSAGLFLRSFALASSVDTGLSLERAWSAPLTLPRNALSEAENGLAESAQARRARFYRELLDDIQATPGIESVSLVSGLPFGGGGTSMSLRVDGADYRRGSAPQAYWRIASPRYFDTLEIPLLEGRRFTARDDEDHRGAVIISRSMAERHWPGESALGKRFFPWERDNDPVEVVGVVADVRERSIERSAEDIVYFPLAEFPFWSPMHLIARTPLEASSVAETLQDSTTRLAPDLALGEVAALGELRDRTLASRRFGTTLLLTFALVALSLAALGIYGVISHSVVQRQGELGIRLAMGATPGAVTKLVVTQTLRVVGLGAAIGLAGALAAANAFEGLLYGVSGSDPLTLLGALAFLTLVALAACARPALRAGRTDAVESLRSS